MNGPVVSQSLSRSDTVIRQRYGGSVKLTSKQEILQRCAEQSRVYFLMDTLRLLRSAYVAPRADADELPPTPNLQSVLAPVEPFFRHRYIFEYSNPDAQKERGPVLVEVEPDSALIEQFLQIWAPRQLGLCLFSDASIDQLARQIANLQSVGLPGARQMRLNLQTPNKLSCVLRALSDERCSELLGWVRGWFWIEGNAGDDLQWFEACNAQPTEASGGFELTETEMQRIDQMIEQRFVRFCVAAIRNRIEQHRSRGEPLPVEMSDAGDEQIEQWVSRGMQSGRELGFTREKELNAYIQLVLFHRAELAEHQTRQLISNVRMDPALRLSAVDEHLNPGAQHGI